jgi:hypothetical protein
MSRINSRHWTISNGCHFQNGRHNTAQIQHCPISTICVVLWRLFWKWRPVEIFLFQESIRDNIIYPHMKCHWNRTMLNLCGIVVAILKMATGRNFSMSGINSGHHYLPTYQILMISDNFNLFFKPVVCDRFGRLHNRYIIMISCFIYFELLFGTILIMRVYKYYYIFRIIFRSRS